MRRYLTTIFAPFIICLSVVYLAGCAEQIVEGNMLVNSANRNLNRVSARVAKIETLTKTMSSLPQTEAGMKRGEFLAQDGVKLANDALSKSMKALRDLKKARKLNLSEDFRTYLDLKVSATSSMVKALRLTKKFMSSSKKMFDLALKVSTQNQLVPLIKRVSSEGKEAETALNASDEDQRRAEHFFKKKRILG